MTLEEARKHNPRVFEIKYEYYKVSGRQPLYLATCKKCNDIIKIRVFKNHSGKCKRCTHHRYPDFYRQYQMMFRGKQKVELTFDEFLDFTKLTNCHYCDTSILWSKDRSNPGRKGWLCYFLDRKDNNKGYSVKNCVVCCTDCNRTKREMYSYEEFLLLSPALKQIKIARNK